MERDSQSLPKEVTELRDSASKEAPVIWMLGPAGSGQTRLLAELTHDWRAALRQELEPATSTSEMLQYPPELPRLRFLLTTGLQPGAHYDLAEDLAVMQSRPGLVLVTLAANELNLTELLAALREVRASLPACSILVAQTWLHQLYPEGLQHPLPYAFDENGRPGPAVPPPLATALDAQRAAFADLAGPRTRFVPIDLTEPEQGQEVLDYGAPALRQAIDILVPELAARLAAKDDPERWIRQQVILPWALAAAAVEAPPLPGLGGLPAIAFQAAMVRAIARRFGLSSDGTIWASLIGVLGTGFLVSYAAGWILRQGLKLVPFWGSAAVAAWSFAVTYGIGEAAIRLCREEAAGRVATPEALREAFRQGHRSGAAQHRVGHRGGGRGGAPR